jgi:BclB C-terminal domain-containing protein
LQGEPGPGAIIPFASGLPVTLMSLINGAAGLPAFIGFGSSGMGLPIIGGTINLTNPAGTLTNFAFSIPRSGTITALSAYFSVTAALALIGTSVTVNASLFLSPTPDNIFTEAVTVPLAPDLTGIVTIGETASAVSSGLSIPVTAGTLALVVFTVNAAGISLLNTVIGYASAGLVIQ